MRKAQKTEQWKLLRNICKELNKNHSFVLQEFLFGRDARLAPMYSPSPDVSLMFSDEVGIPTPRGRRDNLVLMNNFCFLRQYILST